MSIRVMIVEDQAMVRGALVALLALERDLEIVAECADAESALESLSETHPEIVLMDVELPGMSGIDAIARIRDLLPSTRSIVLTTFGRPGYLRSALDAGASGFLVKDAPASELANAIRQIHAGGRAIDPDLAMAALALGSNPLTPRQRDVLRLTLLGRSVGEMASDLSLSEGTVRNYLSEAIGAVGGGNRIDAARIAESHGWL